MSDAARRPDGVTPPGVDDPRLARPFVRTIIRVMSRVNTAALRLTGGRLGGKWRVGSALRDPVDVCLLTTTGAKSGEKRTVPLLRIPDGERLLFVASQGGLPKHPAWYYNVRAHPEVTVEHRGKRTEMIARVADEAERAEVWPTLVAAYADFDSYQRNTSRVIPVVICEPR